MTSTPSDPALASGAVSVRADPRHVFAIVTDLERLADLAEEAHAMTWVDGGPARRGAQFVGRNRNGLRRWSTRCTVTDADADAGGVFAFDVHYGPLRTPIAHWRYDIEPTADGCTVTERMWDRRPGWFVRIGGLATGVQDRAVGNKRNIEATLARLKRAVESPETDGTVRS